MLVNKTINLWTCSHISEQCFNTCLSRWRKRVYWSADQSYLPLTALRNDCHDFVTRPLLRDFCFASIATWCRLRAVVGLHHLAFSDTYFGAVLLFLLLLHLLSLHKLWSVDTVSLVALSLTIYETLKWLSSQPTSMQKSLWWWQCSDRYIISLFPNLHTPFAHFSPSLISRTVSVDVKHHVYLLTFVISTS